MSEGWISLHRAIQRCWIWENEKYLKWWLTILLNVNHNDKKYPVGNEINLCKAGQSFRSIERWTELFSCSKKTTIKFFEMLKRDCMISTEIVGKGNRRKLLLTVLNWHKYQQQYTETIPDFTPKEYPNIPPNNNDNNDNKEEKEISTIVDTKKKEEERKAEIERKKQEQKKKSDAAKAATIKRKELFYEELIPYVERYGKDMIRKFFEYWTEQNKSGTKMKYEIEKTWDLARRLGTWNNREPIGGKNLFSQQPTSTEEKECKWECQAIGLYRTGTYQQYLADVKRNNNQEVKFLGYVE